MTASFRWCTSSVWNKFAEIRKKMKVFESDSNSGRWMHVLRELGFHVDLIEHKVIEYLANFCEVNTKKIASSI